MGFWSRRLDGPNREDFGYKLKSIWSFFRVELGQFWGKKGVHLGLVRRVLKVEFKGVKTHISKLAYKCMKHENMKPIGILKNIDQLETITIV